MSPPHACLAATDPVLWGRAWFPALGTECQCQPGPVRPPATPQNTSQIWPVCLSISIYGGTDMPSLSSAGSPGCKAQSWASPAGQELGECRMGLLSTHPPPFRDLLFFLAPEISAVKFTKNFCVKISALFTKTICSLFRSDGCQGD